MRTFEVKYDVKAGGRTIMATETISANSPFDAEALIKARYPGSPVHIWYIKAK